MFEEVNDYIESLFVMNEMLEAKELSYSMKRLVLAKDPKNSNHIWIAERSFTGINARTGDITKSELVKFIVLVIEGDFSCTFKVNLSSFGKLFKSLMSYAKLHEGYKNIKATGGYSNSFEYNFREIDKFKQFFYDVVWETYEKH